MNNKQLEEIIRLILEQEKKVLKVRGGRGYAVGHPIFYGGKVSTNLGPQNEEEKEKQQKSPVKVSKAFKSKQRKK